MGIDYISIALFFLFLSLSCFAGVGISGLFTWKAEYVDRRVPFFYGVLLGPFLMGISAVIALASAPGSSIIAHIIIVFGILMFLTLTTARQALKVIRLKDTLSYSTWDYTFLLLLLAWFVGLWANATFLPLTQNDALEYAIAARELFQTRDLASYPVLNAATNRSGFFGPWTHPPLYVASIYFVSLLQGHADVPGLMRWLSPWFAVATTMTIYAVGSLVGRFAGFVSALLFISAPLMFLGSDSGLIDSLTAAGFVLGLIPLFSCNLTRPSDLLRYGMVAGIGMWAHSQSLLIVPLALAVLAIPLVRQTKLLFRNTSFFVFGAILIGGWPYWRNFVLFGSPISDNPVVFALPSLRWDDYFTIGRGFSSFADVIQYGWFKGLFAIESYSFNFWIAAVAFLFLFKTQLRIVKYSAVNGEALTMLASCFVILSVYQMGVLVSTSLGIELMIKNERYLLAVLPFAALYGGSFVANKFDGPTKWSLSSVRLFKGFLATVLFLELSVLVLFRLKEYNLKFWSTEQTHMDLLARLAPTRAVAFIKQYSSKDATVLTLKPADMYYAERRMISYLDPRLLPFYSANSRYQAARILTELGVGYVHVPNYGIPAFYNSWLMTLLADPSYAELLFSNNGSQVYRLGIFQLGRSYERDISPGSATWEVQKRLNLGGRKLLFGSAGQSKAYADFLSGKPDQRSDAFFSRDWSTVFSTDFVLDKSIPFSEYLLSFNLSKKCMVRVWISEFDGEVNYVHSNVRPVLRYLAFDAVVPKFDYSLMRRIQPLTETTKLRIEIETVGTSSATLQSASLTSVERGNK